MKRRSVILDSLVGDGPICVGNIFWFGIIGCLACLNYKGKGFESFLVGLGFGLLPTLIGIAELLVRNICALVYVTYRFFRPNEEDNLRKAKEELRIAEIRFEIAKVTLRTRQLEQEKGEMFDKWTDDQIMDGRKIVNRISHIVNGKDE